MEEKVVITDSAHEINQWIERGWKVKEVIAGHISVSGSTSSFTKTEHGKFCFILKK
jgi:hypothetical protein